MESENQKYSSKQDYEIALLSLLQKKKKTKKDEEKYEDLLEEYLRFCSQVKVNGK